MTSPLNIILFMLSTLFGLETVFVAERTHLILDFESRTGSIEYLNLMTPVQAAAYADDGLNRVNNSVDFIKGFGTLKLVSKDVVKRDGKLNVRLNFSFTNQDEILELLRFNQTPFGEGTPADAIYYHLLPAENLVTSNGDKNEKQDDVVITWSTSTKTIELDLNQKASAKETLGDMKSIADYWKN